MEDISCQYVEIFMTDFEITMPTIVSLSTIVSLFYLIVRRAIFLEMRRNGIYKRKYFHPQP